MMALPGMTIDWLPTSRRQPLTISGSPSERRRLTQGVASARVASRIWITCRWLPGLGLGLACGDAPRDSDAFAAAGLDVGFAAPCVGAAFGVGDAGALDVHGERQGQGRHQEQGDDKVPGVGDGAASQ